MNFVEGKSEPTPDFVAVAGQAALKKVENIHKPIFSKHSFVHYSPLVLAGGTNSVSDKENVVNTGIDRLDNILRYGLIAENFAKRVGLTISRNWRDPVNKTSISLSDPDASVEDSFMTATIPSIRDRLGWIPRQNVYVLLIENKYPYTEFPEQVAETRISLRFFRGIVIIDGEGEDVSQRLRERIDFTTSTTQDTVNIVLEKMQPICRSKPTLSLPIYGLSGSLYWPRYMNYQEVQDFVGERRTNGT